MGKRKDFNQLTPTPFTDQNFEVITTPVLKGIPKNKSIKLRNNTMHYRNFDFSNFYGYGYDDITSAFQQTTEIMLSESIVEVTTILSSCKKFKAFAKYLGMFSQALQRDLFLSDINLDLIEKYIKHLKIKYPNGTTAKGTYSELKSVLVKIQRLGWLDRFEFPTNPFPNSNKIKRGHKAFSKSERKRLAYSLKDDAQQIIKKNKPLNSYDLTVLLLSIAFRSGMNTTPLLEMTTDSIKDHPLKDNRKLLVLYKRRGKGGYQMQSIRSTEIVERIQTVFPDVAVMVQCIVDLNQSIRAEINSNLVFLFRADKHHKISVITPNTLLHATQLWVKNKGLKNDNGEPLEVNISRLRKTFTNRIWELSGGDPFVTAAMGNHTVKVSQEHYLEAPKEAEKNFKFMGEVRAEELTTPIKIIANNTPLSKCLDIPNRYDNSGNEVYCTNFLSCVRCRNMVVAKEDLYRLFSFYWLIVCEREQIGARRWNKYFAHVIRIIDREIAPQFEIGYVRTIKEKAKSYPHPAWKHRNQLEELNE